MLMPPQFTGIAPACPTAWRTEAIALTSCESCYVSLGARLLAHPETEDLDLFIDHDALAVVRTHVYAQKSI